MPNNLQFLDDPDDVPFINETLTIHVGVNGSDTENDGSSDSPFRTLGKAVDVVRNKQIKKDSIVTIQLGEIQTDRTGSKKKYFEEEEVKIDFDTAKRLKIKGVKPTDHEVVGISYYDKAKDRDGYYCQIIVTNQDKIKIGDYLSVYDHYRVKKKDPSHFWTAGFGGRSSRSVTTNNCYIESLRGEMIAGVHEVVDVSDTIDHENTNDFFNLSTELFPPQVKIGAVTLFVKNSNHTHKRLSEIPFYNTLGTMGGKPLFTYAAGAGNSPLESQQNNIIPPVFYGADMLSNPETVEGNGFDQFYYSSSVQQIEIVDLMVRGYFMSLSPLDGKIIDPRTGNRAQNATLLWNDKSLNGYNRAVVAGPIATYFYRKMIDDLGIASDLPFYFGKSTNPFVTIEQLTKAVTKVRDYLLAGARQITGVPPWDEDNHPGYGFGPFESGAIRNPIGGDSSPSIDISSYPQEYADTNKFSLLLRYYNLYPPVNGQLYQPTLVRRISSWYNENGTKNGIQLKRWLLKGNESPFFCGYITPQGWYKKRYVGSGASAAQSSTSVPSLFNLGESGGYHRLSGVDYPVYIGNTFSSFKDVVRGTRGTQSNDRTSVENLPLLDQLQYENELGTGGGRTGYKGSMGTIWYAGNMNGDAGDSPTIGSISPFQFDQYSLGYKTGNSPHPNDSITDKTTTIQNDNDSESEKLRDTQSCNLRAKCYKSVLRFAGNGLRICSKTKLALLKDVCIVKIGKKRGREYGVLVEGESVLNATNIAVNGFGCGIGARNQSLVNLLADLKDSNNTSNKGILAPVDPAAVVTGNEIGIESVTKSHVNAQRTVSTGSLKANYLAAVNSSMDCSNSLSVGSQKHGFVSEYNSYMKATNSFSFFNGEIGFCCANNSILVCHRSRSIWNGSHGVFASTKGNIRCYEFISRSNRGDGFLAQNKSAISAGANSSKWTNYRREFLQYKSLFAGMNNSYGLRSMLPPHLFQVTIVPEPSITNGIIVPSVAEPINSNPTQAFTIFFHECNSTISEFNAGSGFASETDSLIIADNTIARYNSKINGEFFIYGWSGTRGSFPTDTFAPFEGVV